MSHVCPGGIVPPVCGVADEADYGFDPDAPDNGLARELTWLYELTYGVGVSWQLASSVVLVGEMRDLETIAAALTLAGDLDTGGVPGGEDRG